MSASFWPILTSSIGRRGTPLIVRKEASVTWRRMCISNNLPALPKLGRLANYVFTKAKSFWSHNTYFAMCIVLSVLGLILTVWIARESRYQGLICNSRLFSSSPLNSIFVISILAYLTTSLANELFSNSLDIVGKSLALQDS